MCLFFTHCYGLGSVVLEMDECGCGVQKLLEERQKIMDVIFVPEKNLLKRKKNCRRQGQ